MILHTKTLSGSRVHTPHTVWLEPGQLAADDCERASERASAAHFTLHIAIHFGWRAACPATAAWAALAHGCGPAVAMAVPVEQPDA